MHPMEHFKVQHLNFIVEACEAVQFGPQPGSAIRGALYNALCDLFSPNAPIPGLPLDPVRNLLEGEDEHAVRGRDRPRAFAVEPPLSSKRYWATGQRFTIGVSLFGTGIALMPYIIRAVQAMGNTGVGIGRGRFRLIRVDEVNPLDQSRRVLMKANYVVPTRLTVTHARVLEEAAQREPNHVTIRFLTPTRLLDDGKLVFEPSLGVVLRRLLERAQLIVESYTEPGCVTAERDVWKTTWARVGQLGDAAELIKSRIRWVDVKSHSKRMNRATPIGGIVGQASWRGELGEALQWLLWGQSLHVGKNAVKGDGWYVVQ